MICKVILITIQWGGNEYSWTGCQAHKMGTAIGTVMIADMMTIILLITGMTMIIVMTNTVLMLDVDLIGRA